MSDPPSTRVVGGEDPAERFWRLGQEGRRPDVDAFLAEAGALSPAQVVAVLRADQGLRWQAGERTPAEAYLHRYPGLRTDPDAVVDLVYGEFLLSEQLG